MEMQDSGRFQHDPKRPDAVVGPCDDGILNTQVTVFLFGE